MVDTSPTDIGNIEQTIEATQVHERTEIGNVLDSTFQYLTFFEFAHDLCTLCFDIAFDKCFVRNNRVLNGFVYFHHFELHGLTNKLIVISYRLHIDLRTWQEGFHTKYIHNKTTFGFAGNRSGNNFTGLVNFNNFLPGTGNTSLLTAKMQVTLAVFFFHHHHFYFITDFQSMKITEFVQ